MPDLTIAPGRMYNEEEIADLIANGKTLGFPRCRQEGWYLQKSAGDVDPVLLVGLGFIGVALAKWTLNKCFDASWDKVKTFIAYCSNKQKNGKRPNLILTVKSEDVDVHLFLKNTDENTIKHALDKVPAYIKEAKTKKKDKIMPSAFYDAKLGWGTPEELRKI